MYYLQSRYYDPTIGRFINADSYMSTEQGLLSNNMFTYCLNNPTFYLDTSGKATAIADPNVTYYEDTTGGGSGGAAVVIIAGITYSAVYVMISALRDFAHAVMDYQSGRYANHQPRAHHVIPKGDFTRYGDETVRQLEIMHQMLATAGISINDPENYVFISQGTHKSLHTKEYIAGIYNIMMQADSWQQDDVRAALFWARIYAASWDKYSNGY